MALIERTAYPSFGLIPSPKELAEFYTPTSEEARFAEASTRGRDSMLGILVMLKGFQRLGYFPSPEAVVSHVRSRLGLGPEAPAIPPPSSRARYRSAYRLAGALPGSVAVLISQDGGVRFVCKNGGRVTYWVQE